MKRAILVFLASLVFAAAVRADDTRTLGLAIDAGGPQGFGASLVVRPLSWLRLHGGGTTDLAAPGVRAGFSLVVPWYIAPSITAEAGYQWPGNFNKLAKLVSGTDPNNALLEHVAYRYASAHGGLELGGWNRLVLTIHAGYSYIDGQTSGLPAYVAAQVSSGTVRVGSEAKVRLLVPSASVGLLLYVL